MPPRRRSLPLRSPIYEPILADVQRLEATRRSAFPLLRPHKTASHDTSWTVSVALSMRQHIVPDEFQGRTAAGWLVCWGSAPIGAIGAGIIGRTAGLRTVFSVAAIHMRSGMCNHTIFRPTSRTHKSTVRSAEQVKD